MSAMKIWVIVYLLIAPFAGFSQIEIKNFKLTDPNLKILYIGIQNNIKLIGKDVDSTIVIKMAKGEVITPTYDNSPGLFYVRVRVKGTDTLMVYRNDSLLLKEIFDVKVIAFPRAVFGRIRDSVASIEQLKKESQLYIISDCFYKHNLVAARFTLSFENGLGETKKVFNTLWGRSLSKEQKRAMKFLKKGEKIIFSDIVAIGPDCSPFNLAPIVITIR